MAEKNITKETATDEVTECYCPVIIDDDWDEKKIDWNGKQFFRATYKCWFYKIKEELDQKIINAYKEISRRGYGVIPNGLNLYKNGLFKGELLIEIKSGSLDDPDVKTFMGYIQSKLYIGPISDLPVVAKTFDFNPLNIYYAYFSCPICTPDQNLQKTVLIAEKTFY